MPENDSSMMDMEVFASGKWHGDEYTDKDLADIVANFNELRDSVKPFLKLGHQGKEEQPALGWVDSMRVQGSKIIASVRDIPQIVFEAITKKLYNRVSSEIYWNYKAHTGKTYNYVLKAVALLGASVPEVKTLNDLTTYLSEQSADRLLVFSEAQKIDLDKKEDNEMPDNTEQIKKFEEDLKAAKDAETAALAKATAAEQELKTFKEAENKKARDAKQSDVKAFCEQAVKDGKMPPFVRDAMFPAEKESVVMFSEDGSSVLLPFEVLKTFIEKVKVMDFSEKGADDKEKADLSDKSPGEIVDIRVRGLIDAKKAKTYSEALARVIVEDPELAVEYAKDPGKKITIR
jgi:hypothetical protein